MNMINTGRDLGAKTALLTLSVLLSMETALTAAPSTAADTAQPTKIVAKKYEFSPKEVTVKRGQVAVLELTSSDRTHGFSSPDLNIRAAIAPGKVVQVKFTPEKLGEFPFFCDVFCGAGHEDMTGTIKVVD